MTEIPGGFPKKVCPETFVSNHTGPIRLAEDQMQRIMLGVCAVGMLILDKDREDATYAEAWESGCVMLEDEPKPEPKQTECPTYDPEGYRKTLEAQIKCLQSNLDAANDRAHMAEGRAYSLMCDYNRCKKEAELEVERLKAQVPKERYSVWIEMNPKTMRWNAFPCAREGVMFDSTATKEETLHKCRDYGFEVLE